MKKMLYLLITAALTALSAAAYGLADASAPTKIQIPFANSAGGSYVRTVPIASQIGIQNGAASYTDGFPPLNFTPINAGGVPPFGQDMNGILRDVSAHARWWAAGGPVYYDGTYQTAIGGYPKGAIVQSAVTTGLLWVSSTENNTTNPDAAGAGWAHIDSTIYAPLTGAGASGTWGIDITGNAATATNATNGGTSGTFTITGTGFTTSPTATATWYKNNGVIHLSLSNAISGTSNATTFTLTGIPAGIRPPGARYANVVLVENNGAYSTNGSALVQPSGINTIDIAYQGNAVGWTASGTKALLTTELSWAL